MPYAGSQKAALRLGLRSLAHREHSAMGENGELLRTWSMKEADALRRRGVPTSQ
jgi:hypothetical protein